jgi:hypothetical protein
MRRLTVVALLLVAAASSSQCDDGTTTVIGPSTGVAPAAAGRFANTGGSTQGDQQGPSGGGESSPGTESSISRLALILVTDRNSDGRPNRGDSITFTIATSLPWDQVTVVCSQNGEVVLTADRTADAWTPLPLTSPTWQAGSADCKATLDRLIDGEATTLASATFTAGA